MRKIFSFIILSLIILSFVNATEISPAVKIYYFYSPTCSHCVNVADSGVLDKIEKIASVERIDILESKENQERFLNLTKIVSAPQSVPLAVIERNGEYSYLLGDTPIINNLEKAVKENTRGIEKTSFFDKIRISLENKFLENINAETGRLNFLGIIILIIAALIDAINPCAFGVLIFLMAGLLSMGSAKRALKAGLIYSIVIFATYFSAGLIIAKAFSSFQQIINPILLIAGMLILIGGLIELKDFLWYGKWFSLSIPASVKPKIEGLIHKGTLPAVLVLGILVALVELPCTGGIYLGILGLMAVNKVFGLGYLALYNLIFVLPLFIITLLIYKGTKTEKISRWVDSNKRYMRLVAGIIMILLAAYLITATI